MTASDNLRNLYKPGALAAIAIVAIIPVQMFVFILWPPPASVEGFYILFQKNFFLGLLSLDLLYILNNILLALVYLALYAALRHSHPGYMLIALVIGLIGIAAYYSSTAAFEMLSLSGQYAAATSAEAKLRFLAAGEVMLAQYKGTAFNVYYVLNAVTLIIIAWVMLRDTTFSRATGVWGLISGILMLVPTTAGKVGLTLGIASLVPWIIFSVLIALRFFRLAREP